MISPLVINLLCRDRLTVWCSAHYVVISSLCHDHHTVWCTAHYVVISSLCSMVFSSLCDDQLTVWLSVMWWWAHCVMIGSLFGDQLTVSWLSHCVVISSLCGDQLIVFCGVQLTVWWSLHCVIVSYVVMSSLCGEQLTVMISSLCHDQLTGWWSAHCVMISSLCHQLTVSRSAHCVMISSLCGDQFTVTWSAHCVVIGFMVISSLWHDQLIVSLDWASFGCVYFVSLDWFLYKLTKVNRSSCFATVKIFAVVRLVLTCPSSSLLMNHTFRAP